MLIFTHREFECTERICLLQKDFQPALKSWLANDTNKYQEELLLYLQVDHFLNLNKNIFMFNLN